LQADPVKSTFETMVSFDRGAIERLCKEYDVERLRIFGSAARGEERPDSDVDLLVAFRSPKGFFALIELENRLSDVFSRRVDLVTEGGLSPFLRDEILSTTSVIFDGAG
jgi:predicted nucleotidyltransferase